MPCQATSCAQTEANIRHKRSKSDSAQITRAQQSQKYINVRVHASAILVWPVNLRAASIVPLVGVWVMSHMHTIWSSAALSSLPLSLGFQDSPYLQRLRETDGAAAIKGNEWGCGKFLSLKKQ
jgi:hypothetical protein